MKKIYSTRELNKYKDAYDKGYFDSLKDVLQIVHKHKEGVGKTRYRATTSKFENFLKSKGIRL
jgi:hypothetical protein